MHNVSDFIFKKFGRLTILEDLGIPDKTKGRQVMAICDCGSVKAYQLSGIKFRKYKSCGCLKNELFAKIINKHGLYGHPIYKLWVGIKSRCNGKHKDYIGVSMCEEWSNDFLIFHDWCVRNGWQNGLQIDKDKLAPTKIGKMYSPEFCCFLTRQENLWYKRNSTVIKYMNESKCLGEWVKLFSLDFKLAWDRIYKRKWSVERAFTTPCLEKYRNKITPKLTV